MTLLRYIVKVTPYVGVWIETLAEILYLTPPFVTPYVGVWIETARFGSLPNRTSSHSLCGSVD